MKIVIIGGVAGGASCTARLLLQNGFKVCNISGGMLSRMARLSSPAGNEAHAATFVTTLLCEIVP